MSIDVVSSSSSIMICRDLRIKLCPYCIEPLDYGMCLAEHYIAKIKDIPKEELKSLFIRHSKIYQDNAYHLFEMIKRYRPQDLEYINKYQVLL